MVSHVVPPARSIIMSSRVLVLAAEVKKVDELITRYSMSCVIAAISDTVAPSTLLAPAVTAVPGVADGVPDIFVVQ